MTTTTTKSKRSSDTTGDALLVLPGRIIAGNIVKWRCPVCRRKMNRSSCKKAQIQMDHVKACSTGGGAEGNLAPMCGSCNASKRDRDLAEWLPARMLKLGRSETITGARRAATNTLRKIEGIRDELTASLIEAGIWENGQ